MPAPMMAPTPRAVSDTGPRTRLRRLSPSASASSTRRDLRANSWFSIEERSVRNCKRRLIGEMVRLRGLRARWPASGRIEDERHRPVVDQLDLHVGAEAAGGDADAVGA